MGWGASERSAELLDPQPPQESPGNDIIISSRIAPGGTVGYCTYGTQPPLPRFICLSVSPCLCGLGCDFFSPHTNTQIYKRSTLWNSSHRMVSSVYLFFFGGFIGDMGHTNGWLP